MAPGDFQRRALWLRVQVCSRKQAPTIQSRLQGTGSSLTKSTNRSVAHRLSDFAQGMNVVLRRIECAAFDQPLQRLLLANYADAAWNALTAGFVAEKPRNPQEDLLQVHGIVKEHDNTGAERGSNGPRTFKS